MNDTPKPDKIEPQSPPESPPKESPREAPLEDPPDEIVPGPDHEEPAHSPDEIEPPAERSSYAEPGFDLLNG